MKNSVQLWDYATHRSIEGEIFDEVTVEHFLETQRDWRPAVIEATKAMIETNKPSEQIPQHFHWDWSTKEEDLRVQRFPFWYQLRWKAAGDHESSNGWSFLSIAKPKTKAGSIH